MRTPYSPPVLIISAFLTGLAQQPLQMGWLAWFSMVPLGKWSLIGCIVTPAFDYKDFELAPPNWFPGKK